MAEEVRNGRRDMLVFLGFVAMVAALALLVVVLRARSDHTWLALGAIGACGQALAVAVGLPYAARQLRDSRDRWRIERSEAKIERLSAYLEQIAPVVERARVALHDIDGSRRRDRIARMEQRDTTDTERAIEAAIGEMRSALSALTIACSRTLSNLTDLVVAVAPEALAVRVATDELRLLVSEASRWAYFQPPEAPQLVPILQLTSDLPRAFHQLNEHVYDLSVAIARAGILDTGAA